MRTFAAHESCCVKPRTKFAFAGDEGERSIQQPLSRNFSLPSLPGK
jgi:hypothetical protein